MAGVGMACIDTAASLIGPTIGPRVRRAVRAAGLPAAVIACMISAACAGTRSMPATSADGVLRAAVAGAAVERVSIRGRDGSLEIHAGTDDSVRVQVVLSSAECAAVPARLGAALDGGTLRLSVEPTTKSHCRETWRVDAPAGVAVTAHMDAADIAITGIEGGLDVGLGYGTVTLDVAAGDVVATVEKGDVIVTTTGQGYGAVRASSQVGRVELRLDGRLVKHSRPAGPGDRIEIEGESRYDIRLRATVGNVRLALSGARAP